MKIDEHGWLDVAIEGNYFHKSEERANLPKIVVIHGTGGGSSALNVAEYFARNDNDSSTHIIIDRDGTIVQGVPFLRTAWGNGTKSGTFFKKTFGDINPNLISVSIELVKDVNNTDNPTEQQIQKTIEVTALVCDTYAIPKEHCVDKNGGILEHREIDPVGKPNCPGTFPWQRFYDALHGKLSPLDSWTLTESELVAPNGIPVVLGFRDYILNRVPEWNSLNLPLEREHGVSSIIRSENAESGTVQTFQDCRLIWSPSRGVQEIMLGRELLWSEASTHQGNQIEVIPAAVREDVRQVLLAVFKLKNDVGIDSL